MKTKILEVNLTPKQYAALEKLLSALQNATDCGALDILVSNCVNPDSINDVCDALEELK